MELSRDENITQIVKELRDRDPETRLQAVDRLSSLKDPRKLDHLINMLGDSEWRIRKSAVMSLSGLDQDTKLAERLIGVLGEEGNVGKRNSAEEALVHMGKAALDALLSRLPGANKNIKKMLIEVLGAIGNSHATPALTGLLNDPDENVIMTAIEAMGRIKDQRCVESLIPLLDSQQSMVSFTAVKALAGIGDHRALQPILRTLNKKSLERVSLEALGSFSDPAVLEPLLKSLQSENLKIRQAALRGFFDYYNSLPELIREKMVIRSAEYRDEDTIHFLIESLGHSEEKIQRSAIRILGWISDPVSLASLLRMLEGPLQEEAISAIVRMREIASRAV